MAKIDEAYEQMNNMAEVYRSFSANNFGIFNWDKMMKEEDKLILSADFQYDKEAAFSIAETEIVYITGNGKGIIKFPKRIWNNLALIPDPGAKMFSILPGKMIALYPADKFAEIEFDDLRQMEAPSYLFDMEVQEKPMESIEDLRTALNLNIQP